jgi:hypothetical protein
LPLNNVCDFKLLYVRRFGNKDYSPTSLTA